MGQGWTERRRETEQEVEDSSRCPVSPTFPVLVLAQQVSQHEQLLFDMLTDGESGRGGRWLHLAATVPLQVPGVMEASARNHTFPPEIHCAPPNQINTYKSGRSTGSTSQMVGNVHTFAPTLNSGKASRARLPGAPTPHLTWQHTCSTCTACFARVRWGRFGAGGGRAQKERKRKPSK